MPTVDNKMPHSVLIQINITANPNPRIGKAKPITSTAIDIYINIVSILSFMLFI